MGWHTQACPRHASKKSPTHSGKWTPDQPRHDNLWVIAKTAGQRTAMPGRRIVVCTRCPICNGGIDWQRNKLAAAVRVGRIVFKNINEQPEALAAYGASLDDVRRRLHATDEDGKLIVGADVAIAIWRVTRGQAWLATL